MIESSTAFTRRTTGSRGWASSVCLGGSIRGLIITLILFMIAGALAFGAVTVTAPNGGESYELGQPVTVTWTATGATAASTLRLDYSSDGGATWTQAISRISAISGGIAFLPPGTPTSLAVVRLVDEASPAESDRSDAPFSILAPSLLVIYLPAENDELVAGSTTNIVWQSARIASIAIEYSSNDGATWTTVASSVPAVHGSYAWQVPTGLTKEGRIRLREIDGEAFATSGRFSIVTSKEQLVEIISPNGGETFTVGDTTRILWKTAYAPLLWISYSTDGGATWHRIRNTYPSTLGYLPWVIPDTASNNYLIRLETGSKIDVSNAPFRVRAKLNPEIRISYPNGGEQFRPDSLIRIVWTVKDFDGNENVVVEYSVDNGATWHEINTLAAGVGGMMWTIPDSTTTTALVRVRRVSAATADTSDATFEILRRPPPPPGPIKVLAPNGGEEWPVGSEQIIRWDAPADVTSVKIEISVDGGFAFNPIFGAAPSTPGNGQYRWTVTNTPSSTARIRISDVTDAARYDLSDGNFAITVVSSGVERDEAGPAALERAVAAPNPASGDVELRWSQRSAAATQVRIFDPAGRLVRTLEAGRREAGEQRLSVSVADLPSGLYRFQIIGSETVSGSISVVR